MPQQLNLCHGSLFDRVWGAVDIFKLASRSGWNQKEAVIATAVALAESGGKVCVINPRAATSSGDHAVGLWQVVENIHGKSRNQLQDPETNAQTAYIIWERAGKTFGKDWSAFNNGAYKKFLPQARKASESTRTVGEFVTEGLNPFGDLVDLASQWLPRVAYALGGSVLIVLGILIFATQGATAAIRPIRKVTKVVKP